MEEIINIFLKTKDVSSLKILLTWLLTPQEIQVISERIQILKLLKQWISQRDVANTIWVSVATVSRWNRVLNYDTPDITNFI